jgi:hypothetical protein
MTTMSGAPFDVGLAALFFRLINSSVPPSALLLRRVRARCLVLSRGIFRRTAVVLTEQARVARDELLSRIVTAQA